MKVRRNQCSKFGESVLSRFGDMGLRTGKRFCVIQRRTECARTIKFEGDVEDIKRNRLSKFGVFMSSRSGDIGPRKLKNSSQNGR